MDTNQWPQGLGLVKPIETPKPAAALERKPRPQKEQAVNCPRCNSINTKFCYYNNYSLSQPRYFCKTCRRYWTEGGTLRNVPVGGGSRKNRRSSTSSSSAAAPASVLKKVPDLSHLTTPRNPTIIHEGHDLNLAYPPTGDYGASLSGLIQLPNYNNENKILDPSNPSNSSSHMPPALELLKSSGISPRGFSSLMSMPLSDSNSIYSSVIPMPHDFKPKLNFSMDGFENGYGSLQESNTARFFLPYEDLKPLSMTNDHQYEQNKEQEAGETNGYWTGMLGSGGTW